MRKNYSASKSVLETALTALVFTATSIMIQGTTNDNSKHHGKTRNDTAYTYNMYVPVTSPETAKDLAVLSVKLREAKTEEIEFVKFCLAQEATRYAKGKDTYIQAYVIKELGEIADGCDWFYKNKILRLIDCFK